MKAIRLYRHPNCAKCAGYARMHRRFDWLGRFEDSTEVPPTGGPLSPGQIAVEDLKTGTVLRGVEGFRLLCRQIPAYWLLLPFTFLPPVRRAIEKEIGGCSDGSCEVPAKSGSRAAE